jgi:hypothetical protein
MCGLGLLFQTSILFIELIVFLIIQPLLTSSPFLSVDILVVFIMGLICFIPFVFFMRGIGVKDNRHLRNKERLNLTRFGIKSL